MTSTAIQLRQSYAFVARNFHLIKRYWGWEIVWIFYAIVNALAVTFIAVGATEVTGTEGIDVPFFTLFLMLGTLVWHYLSMTFEIISEVVAWERWEGTIEYTLMAPVRRWVHLIGQTLFGVVYALFTTSLIGVAMALFFSIDLSDANLFGALLVLLCGSGSLIGIGIVASILPLLYPERGAQLTHIVQAAFLLISGVYYPITVLPGWMQTLALFSPVTYVLDGVRASVMDGVPTAALVQYIVPLLAMGVIALPIGVWAFSRAEAYAKRTGKLKRVG